MVVLEIKVLKEIIEKVPEDFEIEFTSGKMFSNLVINFR